MNNTELIKELHSLQIYFEQGVKRSYALRKKLEQGANPNPAPLGKREEQAVVIELVNKRLTKIRSGK